MIIFRELCILLKMNDIREPTVSTENVREQFLCRSPGKGGGMSRQGGDRKCPNRACHLFSGKRTIGNRLLFH